MIRDFYDRLRKKKFGLKFTSYEEPGESNIFQIVDNTCYSKLVSTAAVGPKIGSTIAGLQYESFVFGGNKEQAQTVTCKVNFCLINSCPTEIISVDADCTNGVYQYKAL